MSVPSISPSVWETVKCDFKSLFPEDVFQMWFEPVVCLETTGDSMTLGVPIVFHNPGQAPARYAVVLTRS